MPLPPPNPRIATTEDDRAQAVEIIRAAGHICGHSDEQAFKAITIAFSAMLTRRRVERGEEYETTLLGAIARSVSMAALAKAGAQVSAAELDGILAADMVGIMAGIACDDCDPGQPLRPDQRDRLESFLLLVVGVMACVGRFDLAAFEGRVQAMREEIFQARAK